MPILASSTYVNAYGKSSSGVVAVTTAAPMDSTQGSQDAFVVKYDTAGKSVWSARIGSTAADIGYGITTDTIGNVYVTGQSGSGAAIFAYNSDGSSFGTILPFAGNLDVFIAKYNTTGTVQWIARIASTGADIGYAVATDASGNLYVGGRGGVNAVVTSFNADGTAFSPALANTGDNDAFIVKYNTSGFVQWNARLASPGSDRIFAIATDPSSNVYVTGASGPGQIMTVFSADGSAFSPTLPNSGSSDAFIVKYNTNGVAQWLTKVASTGIDIAYGIATDPSGNIYMTGQGGSGVVITAFNSDGSSFATTLSNSGSTDICIVKYDTSGFVLWVARIASSGGDVGFALATDTSGSVYVTGQGGANAVVTAFSSTGVAFPTTLPNRGQGDTFLVKYDTSGIVQWVASMGASGQDISYGVAVDSAGNAYVTGQAPLSETLFPMEVFSSNGVSFGRIMNVGGGDAFLVKYNTSGIVQWITTLGSSGTDAGQAVAVDAGGNSYTTGFFSGGRLTVYGSALSLFSSIPSEGGTDAFVVKYNTNGSAQWVARVASTATDIGYAITTDSVGDMYVVGTGGPDAVMTAYNADGTAFGTTLTNAVGADAFVVKYSTSGVVQWIARVAGTGDSNGFGVATDGLGNVLLSGSAGGVVTAFNADGSAFATTNPNAGSSDAFIAKYNSSGAVQWIARVASSGIDLGYAVAADTNGNSYITGRVSGVTTAYNANGSAFPTTVPDTPLVKYNPSGTVEWIAYVSSPGNDYAFGLDTDLSGNVYMTGQLGATSLSVYNADGTAFGTTLANAGSFTDVYVVKYNTSGVVQWVVRIASNTSDVGNAIAVDPSGNVYVGGQGNNIVAAFNANGVAFPRTALGNGFLVKYNTNGDVQWLITANPGVVQGIATDSFGNVYAAAQFGTESVNVTFSNSDGQQVASVIGSASLVKYNTNGIFQWAQVIRGTTTAVTPRAVSVDSFGNSFVTGATAAGQSTVVYSSDYTPYKILNSMGGTDAYVIKYSPTATPLWVSRISSNQTDPGFSVATDLSNNIFAVGRSGDNITRFTNADGTTSTATVPRSGGGSCLYLVKYDSAGTVQWAARTSPANVTFFDVKTDPSGNVYVVGQTGGTSITFFNSNGVAFGTTTTVSGASDAFVVKYNTLGFVQWGAKVGTTGADAGRGIATDAAGNVYITGQGATGSVITAFNFNGTAFGTTLTNDGGADSFLVKYNTTGSVQWIAKVSSSAADIMNDVATDSAGNVYVTGQGGAAVVVSAYDSDGNLFTTNLPNAGGNDAFIVKYNTNGFVQWATRVAGTGTDVGNGIASDSAGNVYVCGNYTATLVSYSAGNIAFAPTLAALGATDGFVVKYDTNGVVQWNARIPSYATENAFDIAVDSAGNVYVSGSSSAQPVAYNADGTFFGSFGPAVDIFGTGGFLIKYNSVGAVQWITGIGGYGTDDARGVAVDTAGNIVITGQFTATAFVAYDG